MTVKTTIDETGLLKVIFDMIVRHHGFPESIVSLLCYFLDIKQKLFTAFHLQTDGQTERQNSTMKAYLWVSVN